MADPTPTPTPPNGWMPTASTAAGGIIGGAVAQIVVAAWNSFMPHHAMDTSISGAVNTLCVMLAGYFFADGGRK